MSNINKERKKKNNVLLLGWVSFLNDLSSDMIMPILPMFIVSLGGGPVAIGFLGGAREFLASIFKVVSGYWSDRLKKRKVFVVTGYVNSAVCKFFVALSHTWVWAVVFSSLERVGKGLRTAARDAIIADSLPRGRGRSFGLHRAMDTAGAVIGAVIVLFLFWRLHFNFRSIILFAALISFFSLLPLYYVEEVVGKKRTFSLFRGIRNLSSPLKRFIFVSALFSLSNLSYMFFIMRTQQVFEGLFSVVGPLIGYIFFNIFYALFSFPAGILSDRWGKARVVLAGYAFYIFTSLGFTLINTPYLLVLLFAFYGISYALVDASQRALVSDLSPSEMRGTSLGIFHGVVSVASFLGNIFAGVIWKITSLPMVFVYGAVLASFASLLLFQFLVEGRGNG